jgi:hypothetical protein
VQGGHAIGISAPRENYAEWDRGQSLESPRGGGGTVVYRALENSAKKKGVRFLLNYHMDAIVRERPSSGRVIGVTASYTPKFLPGSTTPMKPFRSDGVIDMTAKAVTIRARRAVIVATGGSSSNVNFRRMFDSRLTEEYKIQTPPFYAAWASPVVHDTYAGLRINIKCQLMDFGGQVIPGLYCGGESAGGCSQHGQGRAITQGYIAGKEAAGETST